MKRLRTAKKKQEELAKLIEEQQKELKTESYKAYIKGLTNSFEKGKKGTFVGNRIF